MEIWSVPRMWAGETVVIVGNGFPTQEQVDFCRGKARVICINDTFRLAPWADMLYFADARWFNEQSGWWGNWPNADDIKRFAGLKVTIENSAEVTKVDPSVKVLRNDSAKDNGGLCLKPNGIRTGRQSGHQVINIAVHTGVARIVLIGFDFDDEWRDGKSHWFGHHPHDLRKTVHKPGGFYRNIVTPLMDTLVKPLDELGIECLNATPGSKLGYFKKVNLHDVFEPMNDRPVYIDIDGTLTDRGTAGGNPLPERIATVRRMLDDGAKIVVWSGTGTEYARRFVKSNGLIGAIALGKPEFLVDDNPTIRPEGKMPVKTPEEFFAAP